jgi:large subunit ribosomal protein L7/L12
MSQVTKEILEKLKTLTLLEAAELVSQIEETFGVDTSTPVRGIRRIPAIRDGSSGNIPKSEKTTFDVILKSVSDDKRVAALKAIRSLTNLGLKEAKDFCSSLPKTVKEGISKEEAETVKKELEGAGGKVIIE